MKYCKQLAFRSLQVLWLDDSILLLKYQFIAHLLHHFSIIIIISNINPFPPSLCLFVFFHFQYLNYQLLLQYSIPLPPFSIPGSLLFVVAKLNGQPVADTAECGGLHLPVVDGVRKQTDAVIECPLHPKSPRAEVVHAHVVDAVGMEVHHLQSSSGNIEGERSTA